MTRDEILGLSDEELNAEAAERVMQWTLRTTHPYVPLDRSGPRHDWVTEKQGIFKWAHHRGIDDWNPTESITDAFMLVEKLRERQMLAYFACALRELLEIDAQSYVDVAIMSLFEKLTPRRLTQAAILAVMELKR